MTENQSKFIIFIITYFLAMLVFTLNFAKNHDIDIFNKKPPVLNVTDSKPINKNNVLVDEITAYNVLGQNTSVFDSTVVTYSNSSLETALKSYKTFIYFTADNCEACNIFISDIKSSDLNLQGIVILTVNITNDKNILLKYKVNSVNTIVQLDSDGATISKYRYPSKQSFIDNIK